MGEVRAGVDRVDDRVVALLGLRFGYMQAAARIKQHRAAVRNEGRKKQVLENVARMARLRGVPVDVALSLYELLIEASIAYEDAQFVRSSGPAVVDETQPPDQ